MSTDKHSVSASLISCLGGDTLLLFAVGSLAVTRDQIRLKCLCEVAVVGVNVMPRQEFSHRIPCVELSGLVNLIALLLDVIAAVLLIGFSPVPDSVADELFHECLTLVHAEWDERASHAGGSYRRKERRAGSDTHSHTELDPG